MIEITLLGTQKENDKDLYGLEMVHIRHVSAFCITCVYFSSNVIFLLYFFLLSCRRFFQMSLFSIFFF